MKYIYLILCLFITSFAFGQAVGDFRSLGGPWNQASSWETFSGSWLPAVVPPTTTDGIITIRTGTPIDVTSAVDADQVTINGSATLNIKNGGTLRIFDGSGTDLIVTQGDGFFTSDGFCNILSGGTLENRGLISSSLTNLKVDGIVIQNQNGGALPLAKWNPNSLLDVQGVTDTKPTGFVGQTFHNFQWNSTQSAPISLLAELSSIANNFDIINTGTSILILSTNTTGTLNVGGHLSVINDAALGVIQSGTYTINVGGDMTVNSTATAPSSLNMLSFNGSGTGVVINVAGNFVKSNSGNISFVNTVALPVAGTSMLNVTGSFTQNAGKIIMADGTDPSSLATGTISIGGDFTINGGNITETSAAILSSGNINFVTGSHTYTNAGTVEQNINFTVANSATLDLGASAITGAGALTLNASSFLNVGSLDINGAMQTGTSAGNVRNSGARNYNSSSTIVYNGAGAQNIGNGFPSNVNLKIANAAGVTNNNVGVTNVVGTLTLAAGAFHIGPSNTIDIQSNFITSGGTFGGDLTSSLIFSHSGTLPLGTLSFAPGTEFLENLTITRGQDVVLGSNLTVGGNNQSSVIALTSANLNFTGHTLTMNGDQITSPSGYGLISTSSAGSNLVIGGSSYSGSVPFNGVGNIVDNLTFSTTSPGGTYTWDSSLTIKNSLTLSSGSLAYTNGLTMADLSTFIKGGGSISGTTSPTAAGSYNVTYTAAGTTGLELPSASTALRNLTIGPSSGTVTLGANNITINKDIIFSSGTFSVGSNNFTMQGTGSNWTVNGGSFSAGTGTVNFAGTTTIGSSLSGGTTSFKNLNITTSLTLPTLASNVSVQVAGDIANSGTLVAGSATTTFNGTTTISGTGSTSFKHLVISSSSALTAPSGTMNVAGDFTNSGTFTNNAGTIVFNGTSSIVGAVNFGSITVSGILNSPATLNITKNFTNNGTFNSGTGTVVMNGLLVQSIAGNVNTIFNNLTSSNATTVTVSTPQSLKGALTLTTGTFNANGNLTLLSDASGDARIAQIPSGASIAGSIIAKRHLPNGNSTKNYYYLASPVTNALASDWKLDFPITGTFNDPSTQAEWPSISFTQATPSMFGYNEAHPSSTTISDRYESFPANGFSSSSNPQSKLVNGKGYSGFVRFTSPITIDLTGTPAQGPIPVTVTNQTGSVGGNDGWNLIGNPYAAPINWSNVTVPAGVVNAISLYDNFNNFGAGAGVYVSYAGGAGTFGYTGTVSSGQAFWVRAQTTSTITFQEDDKQAITSPQFIRTGPLPDILRVNLSGNGKQDEIVIRFVQDGNDAGDVHYDAFKMNNPPSLSMDGQKLNESINLSSLSSDGQKMAINGMGSLDCSKQVPMVVEGVTAGAYAFKFSQFDSFSNDVQIQLFDAFTGTSARIDHADSVYNFSVTSDPASFGTNRFKVSFSRGPVPSSFALATSNVCKGIDGLVSVGTSQAGVFYLLKMNGNQIGQSLTGNGGSLDFSIPSDSLSVGINRVEVWAQSASCSTASYNQKDSIQVVGVFRVTQVSSTTSCKPGPVTLTANGAPADGRYNWYETIDEIQPIAGQSQSIFTTPVLAKTKTFYVAAVNSAGCEGERIPIRATVVNFDDAVMTQVDETTIQSNYTFGNQWYFNDQLLADTTAILKMESSGVYRLEVKIGGGCTTSDERTFVVTGMELDFNGIKSYPNPVRGVYTVETLDKENQIAEMPIFDALGAQIGTMKLTSQGNLKRGQFDFSQHSSGLYYIRVIRGDNVSVLKVIKN